MMRSFFNIVAAIEVSALWYLTIHAYPKLPSQIVTRLSQSGVTIAVGSKNTILLLPVLITIVYAILTLISITNTTRYSYMFKIDSNDAVEVGARAQILIAVTNSLTAAIFLVLQQMTIQTARLVRSTSGIYIIIALVVLMMLLFIQYARKLSRGST